MKKETSVKKTKKKKITLNYILDFATDTCIKAIKEVNKFLTNKKQNVLVRVIIRIAVCLLLLAILEVPFLLGEKIGLGIIYLVSSTYRDVISSIWNSAIDYSYLIFSSIVLLKVIYTMSKNKDYKFEIKENTRLSDNLYYAACLILKLIIGVSLIPMILICLMLFAIFGMLFCLITHGIIIIGPLIIVAGLIVLLCTCLSYISDVVYFDEGGNK